MSDIKLILLSIKNKVAVIIPMAIIFIYSAKKIKANVPELYSVLNPDTSSDSPSARSNGVRLVSASTVIIHIIRSGHIIIINIIDLDFVNEFNLSEETMIIGVKMTKAILTS